MANTEFDKYIASEIAKYKGVSFPLKSSTLRRLLVRRAKPTILHPNPDDEFSMPEIGPNYKIISDYEHKLLHYDNGLSSDKYMDSDPLIVERMYPNGYMILNGHHRWAAAMKVHLNKIAISIVNLPHVKDIEKMIEDGKNSRRVSMDLDEVVFASEHDTDVEPGLSFPFSMWYKERLRAGIPALFNFFSANGYDIWVYTSKYYSMDHLTKLFKHYHVKVNGMVTGVARAEANLIQKQDNFKRLIAEKYKYTLSIDREAILQIFGRGDGFNEYDINPKNDNWSSEIMRITSEIINNES